jgi:hypothetical protein
MKTPILHVSPDYYLPESETFTFPESETPLYPKSVESEFIRLPQRLPNGQQALNIRRDLCLKFENGRYFNAVQYNITLSHPSGLCEDDFHNIADRKDLVGRFFQAFTPLHTLCLNDPICRTQAATYRQNKRKTRLAFWRGLSDGIEINDGRIQDPSKVTWSTYNLIWTRSQRSDERVMMAVARFGNYQDVGNPTIAPVSEGMFESLINKGVIPTAPLVLMLLEKGGCGDCCP